jgi:hypothetical protein
MLMEFLAGTESGAIMGICVCTPAHRVEIFLPVRLSEWLAHECGTHPTSERSTRAAGAAFPISLGTGRRLLGGVPTVGIRRGAAQSYSPHQQKRRKHSGSESLHVRSTAGLEPEEKSICAKHPRPIYTAQAEGSQTGSFPSRE